MANTVSFGSFQEQLLSLRKYEEDNAHDNREKLDRIIRLIKPAMENELNEKQRDMMQKYYFSGMTMQEIREKTVNERFSIKLIFSLREPSATKHIW